MAGKTTRRELARARRLEAMRNRGVRGGLIIPHRSMVGLPWTAPRFLTTLGLALGGALLLYVATPGIGRLWQLIFERARDFLGLDAPLGDQLWNLPGGLEFTLPVLAVVTPLPDDSALRIATVVSVLVFGMSFLLPVRFTPLRYFLRLLVIVQGTAILFFAISADPFPYRVQDHVFVLLSAGLVVMGLVPLVLGLTLHVFDLALWKKLLLTLAILAHLAIFVPLQVLVHLWLVMHGTALVMPVLFLVFGLLLDVLVFVSFYGWALSWRGELERRDQPPPAHLAAPARSRRR
jgi:hypothetical protein